MGSTVNERKLREGDRAEVDHAIAIINGGLMHEAVARPQRTASFAVPINTKIRRIRSDCCARAASGHAATALPSVAKNFRRSMWLVM
jgi:hypothetical protein